MPIYLEQWLKEAPFRDLQKAQEMERRRIAEEKKEPEVADQIEFPRGSRPNLLKGFVEGSD